MGCGRLILMSEVSCVCAREGLHRQMLWKPLCAFSRFGHQDARTPPSPLVGEGIRGRGTKTHGNAENRAFLLRTLPLRAGERYGRQGKKGVRCGTHLSPL